jgi:putative endopeptidase
MKTIIATTLLVSSTVAVFAAAPQIAPWGVNLSYLDPQVRAGDDFFRRTNGGWLKSAAIPADRLTAGVNLEVDKTNELRLASLITGLMSKADSALTPDERKLRDLFAAYEDVNAIEAAGLTPLKADFDKIAALKTSTDVVAFMANPLTHSNGPFAVFVEIDELNPSAYDLRVTQSGLGLPDRDYYLGTDKELVKTREAYKKYLAQMLSFAGVDDPKRAAAVYELEARLAKAHWPAAERRDAQKTHNPMAVAELEKLAAKFPWDAYLSAAGISRKSPNGERIVVVSEKSAFPLLANIFAETPVAVWRDYLTAQLLHEEASLLPKKIDDANFAFYGVVLNGQKQQLPRELRVQHVLDSALGEALGKLYCDKYFPAEAKAKVQELVNNLLKAYTADVKTLPWMTEATRLKAMEKIKTFYPKIGYPDKWRDYSTLVISRNDLIGDMRNAYVFEWKRGLARIDQTVDRGEWDMTPQTNNAYYNPTLNEIVFPAGILQPPYYDLNADDAVNYGGIGATIGHEMSHGFDDQGSKYDASGRLREWWTDADRKKFEVLTTNVANQYDQFEPLPGLHINGKLTLGENIADIAGLVIAYKAYHISLNGKTAPVLDGYSGDQRFFLAYGQSWREVWTDGLTRRVVLADPHSPDIYRVNGVVRNVDAWYDTFAVKEGEKLYLAPAQRAKIW